MHHEVLEGELYCQFLLQNGGSPLYVASQEGHTEIVNTLLKNGADPNQATKVQLMMY